MIAKVLALLAFAQAHWGVLMAAGGAWILVAGKLSSKWPKPAGPWYVVALHFVFVDLPSYAKALDGHKVSILGFKFDIDWAVPFVSWTTLAPAPEKKG